MQFMSFVGHIRAFFTRKKIIWTAVIAIIILGGWLLFGRKSGTGSIQTGFVTRQDIQKTVLTTGQVVSSTDLDLSFQGSGVVQWISVQEGDRVAAGQVLATLDQSSAKASLESAQGALAQAQANYDKIRAAATTEDIAVTQAQVDSATTALQNAKQNLLRELAMSYTDANTAVLSYTNVLFSNPQSNNPQFSIAGTVQTNSQLVTIVNNERVTINNLLGTWQDEVTNISENNVGQVVTESLDNLSLINTYLANILSLLTTYTQITSGGSQTTVTTYQTGVVTAKTTVTGASDSITADDQAVRTAQASLDQAMASLALKQAPARSEDIAYAQAQVLSAQGQVHAAEAALNNTVLRAPASGTITQVDIKLGELAQSLKEVMKLQNVDSLHAEANVSEADIASVEIGQSIDNTFDALGPEKHFTSKVLTVNPASIIISGVVDYKVTGSLDNIPGIKPGMTDNMTILVAEKTAVLVVPSSALVNQNGKRFVKVIDDPKKKTYHQVEVQTGLEADAGLTEIISGLSEGQEVITYMKSSSPI